MISYQKAFRFFFILAIVVIFALSIYWYTRDDTISYFNEEDGKSYRIRSNSSDKQDAVEYLSTLSSKADIIVDYMYKNNIPRPEVSSRLYRRWKNCRLRETSSFEESIASTINKGHEIRICIRDIKGNFEDFNTSMFVLLHELAHVMSVSVGHTDEFYTNFSYIVHLASYLGIYEPQDFAAEPKNYCGVSINTTPCSQGTCEFNALEN